MASIRGAPVRQPPRELAAAVPVSATFPGAAMIGEWSLGPLVAADRIVPPGVLRQLRELDNGSEDDGVTSARVVC